MPNFLVTNPAAKQVAFVAAKGHLAAVAQAKVFPVANPPTTGITSGKDLLNRSIKIEKPPNNRHAQ